MYQNVVDCVAHTATTQVHKAAVLLCLALMGVGLGVGFSITTTNARNDADADANRRSTVFSDFQMTFTTKLTESASLAKSIGGFMLGDPLVTYGNYSIPVTNFSAPPASRMRFFNEAAYQRLGSQIYQSGITTMALAPGGVVSQMYPPNSTTYGLEISAVAVYASVFKEMMATGVTVTSGPNKYASRPGYGIIVWFPVFINQTISPQTFYGAAYVSMEMARLFDAIHLSNLKTLHKLDYAIWFTAPESPQPTVIIQSDETVTPTIMAEGMRFALPIAQTGRSSFVAVYPEGGPVLSSITAVTAVMVVVLVIVGALACVGLLYVAVFLYFQFRHRRAPANGSPMYLAAITLRGAQPIAERAPLEAVRMFADFAADVHQMAIAHKCYPICEVGDRTVYVVSRDPAALVSLAKSAVADIAISSSRSSPPPPPPAIVSAGNGKQSNNAGGGVTTPTAAGDSASEGTVTHSHHSKSYSRAAREASRSRTCDPTTTNVTRTHRTHDLDTSHSSFIGTAVCRASAALHTIGTAHSTFDAARDVYFYGNAAQIGRLLAALDGTKGGEVGWTRPFEDQCGALHCRGPLESSAVACHIVSEGNDVVLHVASLWKETGDERDNEDPSVAMTSLADVYLKRMTAIVSEGRSAVRERKAGRRGGAGADGGGRGSGADGGEKNKSEQGSSEKSADATSVTRNVTLLHVAVLGNDGGRMPLDTIRRIVAEEKGAVISAHENTIVAAFNLLAPGGHHQIRAADAVMRLRAILVNTPFVCSIHSGKATALIADGLVMCSGDVVTMGRKLLDRALLATAEVDAVMTPSAIALAEGEPSSPFLVENGLCFLLVQSDLSSSYDCEAVDVTGVAGSVVLPNTTAANNNTSFFLRNRRRNAGNGGVVVPLPTHTSPVSNAPPPAAVPRGIIYRLSHRKALGGGGGKNNNTNINNAFNSNGKDDDEWMYQLRDEEDASPFAAVNAVFHRIASGQREEAARCWRSDVLGEEEEVSKKQRANSRNAGSSSSPIIIVGVGRHAAAAACQVATFSQQVDDDAVVEEEVLAINANSGTNCAGALPHSFGVRASIYARAAIVRLLGIASDGGVLGTAVVHTARPQQQHQQSLAFTATNANQNNTTKAVPTMRMSSTGTAPFTSASSSSHLGLGAGGGLEAPSTSAFALSVNEAPTNGGSSSMNTTVAAACIGDGDDDDECLGDDQSPAVNDDPVVRILSD